MTKVMLIDVTEAEESRVAIVEDGRLEWIEIEAGGREKLKGNIYKASVESVNVALQAAFVRLGASRSGFLPLDEVNFKTVPQRKRGRRGREPEAERDGRNRGARSRIQDHLSPGQEVLVQVVREPLASKPPTVSTFISLAGRYLVLLPGTDAEGISRKIEDEADRERLKRLVKEIKPPAGCGMILRTAGIDQTRTELSRDMRYLVRLWQQIDDAGERARAPALIYRERDLVLRAIRDLLTPDISEVILNDEETARRAEQYFASIIPAKQKLLKTYAGDQPLFSQYNLEEQIENIYRRRVPLRSGGAIVIDETEALTSIDVNSGKTREANIEETALRTNLEAVDEICRQIRLRDIGGLIVMDFIDMRGRANIRDVEKRLKEAMKPDSARFDVTRISKLGLLEMSRQRLRSAPAASAYRTCDVCEGGGVVKTVESTALGLLRRIQSRAARADLARIKILLPPDVASFLVNRKREELFRIEERYQIEITIVGRQDMNPMDLQFEVETRAEAAKEAGKEAEPRVKPPELEPPAPEDLEAEAEAEAQAEGEAEGEAATPPREGRRRGSRGGRGRRGRGTESRARPKGRRPKEATAPGEGIGGESGAETEGRAAGPVGEQEPGPGAEQGYWEGPSPFVRSSGVRAQEMDGPGLPSPAGGRADQATRRPEEGQRGRRRRGRRGRGEPLPAAPGSIPPGPSGEDEEPAGIVPAAPGGLPQDAASSEALPGRARRRRPRGGRGRRGRGRGARTAGGPGGDAEPEPGMPGDFGSRGEGLDTSGPPDVVSGPEEDWEERPDAGGALDDGDEPRTRASGRGSAGDS